MRKVLLGLVVLAVFGAGCVAGASHFGVPKAKAANVEGQRWAYFCFDAASAEDVHNKANAAAARGWEMVSGAAGPSGMVWCFKQPKP